MMKFGTIKCHCGKEFYFETVSDVVECVYCGEKHTTFGFDEKVEVVEDVQDVEVIDEELMEFAEEVSEV